MLGPLRRESPHCKKFIGARVDNGCVKMKLNVYSMDTILSDHIDYCELAAELGKIVEVFSFRLVLSSPTREKIIYRNIEGYLEDEYGYNIASGEALVYVPKKNLYYKQFNSKTIGTKWAITLIRLKTDEENRIMELEKPRTSSMKAISYATGYLVEDKGMSMTFHSVFGIGDMFGGSDGTEKAHVSVSFMWNRDMIEVLYRIGVSDYRKAEIKISSITDSYYYIEKTSQEGTEVKLHLYFKLSYMPRHYAYERKSYMPLIKNSSNGYNLNRNTIIWSRRTSWRRTAICGANNYREYMTRASHIRFSLIYDITEKSFKTFVDCLNAYFTIKKLPMSPRICSSSNCDVNKIFRNFPIDDKIRFQFCVLFTNFIVQLPPWHQEHEKEVQDMVEKYGVDSVLYILENMFDPTNESMHPDVALERISSELAQNHLKIKSFARRRYDIPDNCRFIRRVYLTPTSIIYLTPCVEITNRIIRKYCKSTNDFFRLTVNEEDFERLVDYGPISRAEESDVLRRIELFLKGIRVNGRKYELLAFSSAQLRGNSCWFYAEVEDDYPKFSAEYIREDSGNFPVDIISKYAARLGQCFSTSINLTDKLDNTQIIVLADVERNGHVFSDGVGIISIGMAKRISSRLKLKCVPSCFQFRLGGYKGVVSTEYEYESDGSIKADDEKMYIKLRDSQKKFDSTDKDFEVVSYSQPSIGCLNKQIINILVNNGVPEANIMKILISNIKELEDVFYTREKLLDFVMSTSESNALTFQLAKRIIESPMYEANEKCILSIIECMIMFKLHDLKTRTRIKVQKSSQPFGIMDNYKLLKPDEVFFQYTNSSNAKVIVVGPVIVTRSPCHFPGDVRLLNAVNPGRPELTQFCDVIVFPSVGEYPLPKMMSGGDLDGDTFFISWEPLLIENFVNKKFHNFSAATGFREDRISDNEFRDPIASRIASFFVKYMINDNLGRIANLHLALTDILEDGLEGFECLSLARAHSIAVDFPKTGIPARINLPFIEYYPHFMNKDDKPYYISKKILGSIYTYVNSDAVRNRIVNKLVDIGKDSVYFLLQFKEDSPKEYIDEAVDIARAYHHDMFNLSVKYGIGTEVEVFTSIVSEVKSDYFKREGRKIGFRADCRNQLAIEVSRILETYKELFWERVSFRKYKTTTQGGHEGRIRALEEYMHGKFSDEDLLRKMVISWYVAVYDPEYEKKVIAGSRDFMQPSIRTLPLAISDVLVDVYKYYYKKRHEA